MLKRYIISARVLATIEMECEVEAESLDAARAKFDASEYQTISEDVETWEGSPRAVAGWLAEPGAPVTFFKEG